MSHESKDYIHILRSQGYRVTPQRLIVLDAVCELGEHATVPDIVERVAFLDQTIDRSTVYRALEVLTEVGLIVKTEMGDQGTVYHVADSTPHHHLLCRNCGSVMTIDAQSLAPLFQHLLETYGFEVQSDHLAFSGLCKQCRMPSNGE